MPLYDLVNDATGETLEVFRSVARRDEDLPPGFRRVMIPVRVGIHGSLLAATEPTIKDKVLRGYYAEEQKWGTNFRSGFSKKQIRRIWDRPNPN